MARGFICALVALAFASAVAACGGNGDGDGAESTPPVAEPADFPQPAGKTIAELRESLGPGPVLAPAVSVLEPGDSERFGFGVFDRARRQIADAPTVLYVANADGEDVQGPFPARYESLEVSPAFASSSVTADPDSAKSVYVADLAFPAAGDYQLLGVLRLDDQLVAADPIAVKVVEEAPVPDVGERAPKISTPTVEDVNGRQEEIDTRIPPGTMHDVDFADVLGDKPIMLVFATPALCVSRVCGPVVDIAEELKAERGDDAAFIHMEIYNENETDKGFREQVRVFNLPTEPWAFAIGADGRVAARLEGAWSKDELERALDAAVKG